ncbi:MAG: hypothetical protein AAF687_00285 [Pseudomonadota bacterium]
MKLAKGPRPWPIWLFTILTIGIALLRLSESLRPITNQRFPEYNGTMTEAEADWLIIKSSARFTIDLIPVAWVFLFASRFARWFVTAMAFVPLVIVFSDLEYASTYPRFLWFSLISAATPIMIAGLLFTPKGNRWFRPEDKKASDAFD